ncbi:MarR family transcriptional regulator [Solihabitans fulvus]|uniref:MarR family transcriptional regulator n=1 Tax=Solihabitans fulvus TaxID=1892852 RepID=A0A5B2WPY9_9PSEU|nr:MarR family transcriptional regulator [Solihabitans fulvus]KAA2253811.1 MarR family transcriptional regulator [Solihabitans fulvus]
MGKVAGEQLDVATALVRSAFLVNAVYAEAARNYGLTPQQGQLLCVLMPQPYGMSELGTVLGLAKSSLTGLVDRSARRGLVRRGSCPDDARAVSVELTAAGRELAEDFYTDTCRRVEALADGLASADRDALVDLVGQVVRDNKVPVVFMTPDEAAAGH